MAPQRRLPAILVAALLVTAVAACGGPVAPTVAPTPTVASNTTNPATPKATEPPPSLELLWEASEGTDVTGWYPGTYSPAVDPLTGDIWVALSSEHRIWIFSEDGEYRGSFGEPGDGPGQFDFRRPQCRDCPGSGAMAFAPDGTLFVADVGNHRVQKFDPEHEFELEWGGFGSGDGRFADALGIATNGTEVFVGDDARGDTQVFDLDGVFLRTLTGGWLAVDPTGGVSMSAFGTVFRYDAEGNRLDSVFLPSYPGAEHVALAIDGDGRLFFNVQDSRSTHAIGLGMVDPATGASRLWSTAGETLAIAGDVIYLANYTGEGWPDAVLRAYRLPEP